MKPFSSFGKNPEHSGRPGVFLAARPLGEGIWRPLLLSEDYNKRGVLTKGFLNLRFAEISISRLFTETGRPRRRRPN